MPRWLVALVLASCQPDLPSVESSVPLDVFVSGCDEVAVGCAVTGDEVRLWTPSAGPVEVGGDAGVDVEQVAVDGGVRVVLPVSTVPARIRIVAPEGATQLDLVPPVERPRPDEERCGDSASAAAAADPVAAAAQRVACAFRAVRQAPPEDRLAASAERDEALAAHIAVLDAAGERTAAAKQRAVQVHLAASGGDLDHAWRLLHAIPPSRNAEIEWTRAYMSTSLARQGLELREAAEHLDLAQRWVERVDATHLQSLTDNLGANVSTMLGDLDGALDAKLRASAAMPLTDETCDPRPRELAENAAWTEALRRSLGRTPSPDIDPQAVLDRVAAAHERCGAQPAQRSNTAVNRAMLAAQRRDWRGVLTALGGLQADPTAEVAAWGQALRASALLETGRAEDAAVAAERALSAGRSGASIDAEVFAWTVMADVNQAAGRVDLALEDLGEAQEALWSRLPDLPAGADRGSFVSTRSQVTPRLVGLLLASDRPDDAMVAFRRARVRALRSLREVRDVSRLDSATRERWRAARARYAGTRQQQAEAFAQRWALSGAELAAADAEADALRRRAAEELDEALAVLGRADADDRLRAPAAGELLVGWLPIGGSWVALTVSTTGAEGRAGPPGDTPLDALPDLLAASVGDLVREVDRVTILPWGVVHGLDMHAATLDERPLVATVTVAYSVDLPPRSRRSPGDGELLVVSDTREDLPHARAEADRVLAVADGTAISGAAATRATVIPALGRAQRLHFAGHGLLDPAQIWRSGLALADGDLEVGDILALPSPPRQVVLSGCETGRTPDGAQVAALGVAQAFVMAGADAVVATSRPVRDDAAVEIATGLWGEGGDMAERLRRGQLGGLGGADWPAWRVWIP